MIKKFKEFENKELQDYTNGISDYAKISGIFINDRKNTDWYIEIGKYIYSKYGNNLPKDLKYFGDFIKKDKNDGKAYSAIGTMYLTSFFDSKIMLKLWGEPTFHDEFGEGFEGKYDEETDEYSEPENKFQFSSYFVTINNIKFHIGYDHRGTTIEVQAGTKPNILFDCIKILIDDIIKLGL